MFAKKNVFSYPSWADTRSSRKPGRPTDGRQPGRIYSDYNVQKQLIVAISDENGATIEGCQLRFVVWQHREMQDITVVLEAMDDDRLHCISRMDIRPNSPHPNRNSRQLKIPPEVSGSHLHSFELNARLGPQAFVENLPAALPLETEPQSFRDIFALVEIHFRIDGVQALEMPPFITRGLI